MLSASTSAASSSAFQPTEQVSVDELQALICQVRDFKAKSGKCPTRSKTNKEEDSLAKKVAWNLNNRKFTAAQKRELKELQDGAPQPVVDLQALICEVRDWIAKHGKFPIQSKTNKDEKSLARRLLGNKDQFTAAQKLELKELKDGTASDGAPQPVDDLQALILEVRDWIAKHGKFPIQSKTNNDEKNLAKRLLWNRDQFTAAQKLKLK